MSNIEKDSQAAHMSQSPSIAGKSAKAKGPRNYEMNTLDLDGKANIFGVKQGDSKAGGVAASANQTVVNNSVRQTTELGIDDLM